MDQVRLWTWESGQQQKFPSSKYITSPHCQDEKLHDAGSNTQ